MKDFIIIMVKTLENAVNIALHFLDITPIIITGASFYIKKTATLPYL